jgi:hypothetical protein
MGEEGVMRAMLKAAARLLSRPLSQFPLFSTTTNPCPPHTSHMKTSSSFNTQLVVLHTTHIYLAPPPLSKLSLSIYIYIHT